MSYKSNNHSSPRSFELNLSSELQERLFELATARNGALMTLYNQDPYMSIPPIAPVAERRLAPAPAAEQVAAPATMPANANVVSLVSRQEQRRAAEDITRQANDIAAGREAVMAARAELPPQDDIRKAA